jgi:hypothetical protein
VEAGAADWVDPESTQQIRLAETGWRADAIVRLRLGFVADSTDGLRKESEDG